MSVSLNLCAVAVCMCILQCVRVSCSVYASLAVCTCLSQCVCVSCSVYVSLAVCM